MQKGRKLKVKGLCKQDKYWKFLKNIHRFLTKEMIKYCFGKRSEELNSWNLLDAYSSASLKSVTLMYVRILDLGVKRQIYETPFIYITTSFITEIHV